jgi:hypothetical protein
MKITRAVGAAVSALAVSATLVASAGADSIGPTTFESPGYSLGNINGQNGWTKTGSYDVEVADVSTFADASGYGFGDQALRVSDAVTSGSFGDQTFSAGLANPAGEAPAETHFEASFKIGTTQAALQQDLRMSVSPDNGSGARMSYLRFEDQADGVHVFFDDVTDAGPLPTVATFNEEDIATIDRAGSHTIMFSIDFEPGPANDVVKISIDGTLKKTGTTWEDYYRFDPEQTGGGNVLSPVSKLLFRASGTANVGNAGQGFLIDDVSLASSTSTTPVGSPTDKDQCKKGGWKTFVDPSFKNQGACVSYVATRSHGKKGDHVKDGKKGEHSKHGTKGEHSKKGEHGRHGKKGKHGEQGKQSEHSKQSEHGKRSDNHEKHGSDHGQGGKHQ